MPETGQPGGGGRSRGGSTQGGLMAGGSRGPFVRSFYIGPTAGNVARVIKCPLGVRWNLISARFYLDTDATVANRYTQIEYRDGDGEILAYLMGGGPFAANTVSDVDLGPSVQCAYELYFPLPLVDGMQLHWFVTAGVVGDSWYGRFVVMEWKI